MDKIAPFTGREEGTVRKVARYTLSHGGLKNPSASEIFYMHAFELFMLSAGTEYGDVFHLPYSGGVLEQPSKTAKVWGIFKGVLMSHISKENKKNAAKMKRR